MTVSFRRACIPIAFRDRHRGETSPSTIKAQPIPARSRRSPPSPTPTAASCSSASTGTRTTRNDWARSNLPPTVNAKLQQRLLSGGNHVRPNTASSSATDRYDGTQDQRHHDKRNLPFVERAGRGIRCMKRLGQIAECGSTSPLTFNAN